MPDTQRLATVLAAFAGLGTITFVVGTAALAAQYGGVWAGVTVGAFFVVAVTLALLYAFGEMETNDRRQTRF